MIIPGLSSLLRSHRVYGALARESLPEGGPGARAKTNAHGMGPQEEEDDGEDSST
jgi:hypothetical protein